VASAAANIDFTHVLTDKLPMFIVIIVRAFLLLLAVFRSLLIPLVAQAPGGGVDRGVNSGNRAISGGLLSNRERDSSSYGDVASHWDPRGYWRGTGRQRAAGPLCCAGRLVHLGARHS
jgi:hypothetical protein